ncbi:MAG: hypothetical protein OEX04_11200 [Acidimicrobiia bacterium]|nr:hypothetical protein [Acidimicrobiia bacterium]MDH4308035.1 hypothetical protein [Acidimicrobiia bacterium]MDH5294619.1 hypothetical protein [Acidimicrobiia bacterium]
MESMGIVLDDLDLAARRIIDAGEELRSWLVNSGGVTVTGPAAVATEFPTFEERWRSWTAELAAVTIAVGEKVDAVRELYAERERHIAGWLS